MKAYNLLIWKFSPNAVNVRLSFSGSPARLQASHVLMDASTASNEKVSRPRRQPAFPEAAGEGMQSIAMEAFGIHFISLTTPRSAA